VQSARVNGLDIGYRISGAGPPIVLVHGAGDDSRVWRPQLAGLADEFTIVAWDEPGAGRSADLPPDFGLAEYAACLVQLIESLELGPVHLVGLSWGGVVALQAYAERPSVVESLVLADTYAGWKGSLEEEELEARVAGVRRMLAAPPGEFDASLPGLFAAAPSPALSSLMAELAAGARRESLAAALTAIADADLRGLLPQVEVPTLLIWGEQDVRSPLTVAAQFAEAIAHAVLVVLPDCGHLSNLEQPERFNELLRQHCRQHPVGDGR
jgi:pimeloyl-ACP methyl ester carboxylesterase